MKDVKEMLKEFSSGMAELSQSNPENMRAFRGMLGANGKDGAISAKTKELMSVAIAAYTRCEYCMVYHVYTAYQLGATREELIEAAMVAVDFGAGPTMAYTVTTLMACINEFEPAK